MSSSNYYNIDKIAEEMSENIDISSTFAPKTSKRIQHAGNIPYSADSDSADIFIDTMPVPLPHTNNYHSNAIIENRLRAAGLAKPITHHGVSQCKIARNSAPNSPPQPDIRFGRTARKLDL